MSYFKGRGEGRPGESSHLMTKPESEKTPLVNLPAAARPLPTALPGPYGGSRPGAAIGLGLAGRGSTRTVWPPSWVLGRGGLWHGYGRLRRA